MAKEKKQRRTKEKAPPKKQPPDLNYFLNQTEYSIESELPHLVKFKWGKKQTEYSIESELHIPIFWGFIQLLGHCLSLSVLGTP
jgi:hypothetical protein